MMRAINAEYTELFKVYKDVHQSIKKDAENATYTAEKATNEAPVDFINIISELLKMPGIAVELCGRWLWIGGDTKPYKDKLKEIGCKWCNTKKFSSPVGGFCFLSYPLFVCGFKGSACRLRLKTKLVLSLLPQRQTLSLNR